MISRLFPVLGIDWTVMLSLPLEPSLVQRDPTSFSSIPGLKRPVSYHHGFLWSPYFRCCCGHLLLDFWITLLPDFGTFSVLDAIRPSSGSCSLLEFLEGAGCPVFFRLSSFLMILTNFTFWQ